MITKRDTWWWAKSNAALRESIARGYFRSLFDSIILTEYPKSGGTWLSQMLSDITELPYARDRLPVFTNSILHGCWLHPSKHHKTITLFRDGRDIMASYYFHLIFPKPNTRTDYSNMVRRKVGVEDPDDIQQYMPAFIKWAFTEGFPGWTWSQFIDRWHNDPLAISTSYEALTLNPTAELSKILEYLGIPEDSERIQNAIEKYSFAAQSGRARGEQDNTAFVRKGVVGDWVNCFNRESADLFAELAGNQLIAAGYESDHNWVAKVG